MPDLIHTVNFPFDFEVSIRSPSINQNVDIRYSQFGQCPRVVHFMKVITCIRNRFSPRTRRLGPRPFVAVIPKRFHQKPQNCRSRFKNNIDVTME